ncbi:hypothetical protein B0H17DRAFT_865281, partial [Mycena rosella]
EIARYDTEISRVKAQLGRLEADHAALHTHYVTCRGLLSPIRRLPSEILVDIFALCAGSFAPECDIGGDGQETPVAIEMSRIAQMPLLTASAVCSRWHTIVMGTPTLWDTVELNSVLWTAPDAN